MAMHRQWRKSARDLDTCIPFPRLAF